MPSITNVLTVASIAELKAIDVENRRNLQPKIVADLGDGQLGLYIYFRESTEVEDLPTVIAPGDNQGRWKLSYARPLLSELELIQAQFKPGEWGDFTLQNGWRNFSSEVAAKYRKHPSGLVECRGWITGGKRNDGTVIARLPEGFRPTFYRVFVYFTDKRESRLFIDPDGHMIIFDCRESTLYFDFQFMIDQ